MKINIKAPPKEIYQRTYQKTYWMSLKATKTIVAFTTASGKSFKKTKSNTLQIPHSSKRKIPALKTILMHHFEFKIEMQHEK